MQIKLAQLIGSVGALSKLADTTTIKAKTSYAIARDIRLIEAELTDYDKARMNVVERYSIKREDGSFDEDEQGNRRIRDIVGFNREIEELINTEVDINLRKVSVDDLDNAELSPNQILAIDFLLEEE